MESPVESHMTPTVMVRMLDTQDSVTVSSCVESTDQNVPLEEIAFSKHCLPNLENIKNPAKISSKSGSFSNVTKTRTLKVDSGKKSYASLQDTKPFKRKYPSIQHHEAHAGKNLFKCIVCSETFSNEIILHEHKRSHGEIELFLSELITSVCEKLSQPTQILEKSDCSNNASRLRKQSKNSVGVSYGCDICGRLFTRKYDLKRHQALHTEGHTVQCPLCNIVLVRKERLKIHMQEVHSGEKLYECEVCRKTFIRRTSLVQHSRIHTGEKPFNCEICNRKFSSYNILKRHRRVHTGEEPYDCEVCKKSFSDSVNLKRHRRIHTGEKPFTCEICNKGFSITSNLRRHKHVHTGEKPYECEMCKKCFSHSSYLRKHILIHNRMELLFKQPMESPIGSQVTRTVKKRLLDTQDSVSVSSCVESTDQIVALEEIAFSKQGLQNLENFKKPAKISSKSGSFINVSKTKTLKIDSGKKSYASLQDTKLSKRKYPSIHHHEVHVGKNLFKCIICSETFSNEIILHEHKRSHGEIELFLSELITSVCEKLSQPTQILEKSDCSNNASKLGKQSKNSVAEGFGCDTCGKLFARKFDLKRHQALHTEGHTVQCPVCNQVLARKKSLKKHMQVHNGEKLFECDVCKKTFTRKTRLVQHIRIHTGEKPFNCEICNKRFSCDNILRRHRRVHTGEEPYECEVCTKSFSDNVNLKRHRRIHTGEKPFTCEICNKGFSITTNLRRHRRVHTGEKPYECDVCKKCFSQSSYLRKHIRIHSREEP